MGHFTFPVDNPPSFRIISRGIGVAINYLFLYIKIFTYNTCFKQGKILIFQLNNVIGQIHNKKTLTLTWGNGLLLCEFEQVDGSGLEISFVAGVRGEAQFWEASFEFSSSLTFISSCSFNISGFSTTFKTEEAVWLVIAILLPYKLWCKVFWKVKIHKI